MRREGRLMPRLDEFANLAGQRYGKLTALRRVARERPARWDVRCDCGTRKSVLAKNLRAGLTTSCGLCGSKARSRARAA